MPDAPVGGSDVTFWSVTNSLMPANHSLCSWALMECPPLQAAIGLSCFIDSRSRAPIRPDESRWSNTDSSAAWLAEMTWCRRSRRIEMGSASQEVCVSWAALES
jgi:hypothetical protein